MNTPRVVVVVLFASLFYGQGVANAGLIYTSNTQGAWNYSFQQGGPGDGDPFYYSTSLADVANASFQGMVLYNYVEVGTGIGAFGPVYDQPGSTYHVFSTYVTSASDQTIHLGLAGDDGHSLFVNGSFVTGAGFGGTGANPNASYDLVLRAGVEVQLKLVGHDAYGSSWIFGSTDPGTYRGVTISADSTINAVPAPPGIVLASIAMACFTGHLGSRRRTR